MAKHSEKIDVLLLDEAVKCEKRILVKTEADFNKKTIF